MDARIKMMEGNVISVRVPIKIKRYGGKKLILLPEGAHMTAPQEALKPDETLVKALAKAYYWQNLLDTGRSMTCRVNARLTPITCPGYCASINSLPRSNRQYWTVHSLVA